MKTLILTEGQTALLYEILHDHVQELVEAAKDEINEPDDVAMLMSDADLIRPILNAVRAIL